MNRRFLLKSGGMALAGSGIITIAPRILHGMVMAQDERSDLWARSYVQRLPAGEFEVKHIPKTTDGQLFRTQVILRSDDLNYDFIVGMRATRWFMLRRAQEIRFHLENDPILTTVWVASNNPTPRPSPAGGTMVRWTYDAADVIFRHSYGGTGVGLTPGGTRLVTSTANIISSPPNPDQWARGMSALAHSTDPESWVRGSASLDRSTGVLSYTMQLETDSVAQGPKGKVIVEVFDASNTALARAEIEAGMGGKPPGKAVIRNFTGQKTVPAHVAQRAARIGVTAQHNGGQTGLFGVSFDDVLNLVRLIILVGG